MNLHQLMEYAWTPLSKRFRLYGGGRFDVFSTPTRFTNRSSQNATYWWRACLRGWGAFLEIIIKFRTDVWIFNP